MDEAPDVAQAPPLCGRLDAAGGGGTAHQQRGGRPAGPPGAAQAGGGPGRARLRRRAYDARGCYEAIHAKGARAAIPPREGSTLRGDEYLRDRNANLRQVREHGAAGWKKKAKYHRRSLAETAISRTRTLSSDKLRAREAERQKTGVMVRCAALNRMTELGMPLNYAARGRVGEQTCRLPDLCNNAWRPSMVGTKWIARRGCRLSQGTPTTIRETHYSAGIWIQWSFRSVDDLRISRARTRSRGRT